MNIKPPFYVDDLGDVEIGNIIGVVSSLDVVKSKFSSEDIWYHEDHWGSNRHYKKWRWNNVDSLHWFLPEHKPDEAQIQFVRDHLSKSYGIKWLDNGRHDWGNLHKQLEKKN